MSGNACSQNDDGCHNASSPEQIESEFEGKADPISVFRCVQWPGKPG
jgi:hypothetical protein